MPPRERLLARVLPAPRCSCAGRQTTGRRASPGRSWRRRARARSPSRSVSLLGEPDGDEEDDAPDDQQRVQDEHRAHDAGRVRLEARLPCPRDWLAVDANGHESTARERIHSANCFGVAALSGCCLRVPSESWGDRPTRVEAMRPVREMLRTWGRGTKTARSQSRHRFDRSTPSSTPKQTFPVTSQRAPRLALLPPPR